MSNKSSSNVVVCPFVSNAPYIMGCDRGHIILLPTGIKCETVCAAWEDDHCIRLINRVASSCECGGHGNADETD